MTRMRYLPIGVIFALAAFAQDALKLPEWLQTYPGATASVQRSPSLVESTYSTTARLNDVVEHYRKLFESANVAFHPNPDGIGISILANVPECDLLIQIRENANGTAVHVSGSPKSGTSGATFSPGDVKVTNGQTGRAPLPQARNVDMMQRHRDFVAEMKSRRPAQDVPAPPLMWPSWLVHLNGSSLPSRTVADGARKPLLVAEYTTLQPMTEIRDFYRDLIGSHDYTVTGSGIAAGSTQKGVQQNALGYVRAENYPDGAPGAHSDINFELSRMVLNGPITVHIRFETFEFIAPKR